MTEDRNGIAFLDDTLQKGHFFEQRTLLHDELHNGYTSDSEYEWKVTSAFAALFAELAHE